MALALISKAFSKGGDKIDFVDNFQLMGLHFSASGFRRPVYELSAKLKCYALPITERRISIRTLVLGCSNACACQTEHLPRLSSFGQKMAEIG